MNRIRANCYHSVLFCLIAALCCSSAPAQQIGVTTPFNSVSDSYYENMGVNFGFSLPGGQGPGSRLVGHLGNGVLSRNVNFFQGSAASAIPQFGGYDPNANARFGFGRFSPGGGGFSLGFDFGKGNTRTLNSTAPSIVVPNGYGGTIVNGSFVPFVTSVTPINGMMAQRPIDNAVTRAMQSGLNLTSPNYETEGPAEPMGPLYSEAGSSAQAGDSSVAAIKAQRAAAAHAENQLVSGLIKQAQEFEIAGDLRKAGVYYRKAIKASTDESQIKQLRSYVKSMRKRQSDSPDQ